ncbi:MAG: hypothetical protein ACLR8P_07555 [Clostridium fessum]
MVELTAVWRVTKSEKAAAEPMTNINCHDWRAPVSGQRKLSITINDRKAAKRLGKVIEKITPRFDVIILIDTKQLRAIRQGFVLRKV